MRDWLSHRVAASPDATALVRASDGEAWSYADLDRLVAETAGRLAAAGVDANDHLGVLLPPCVGYVGLAHAAMRLGATLVPFGDDLTPRELAARVERADLDAFVCGEETEAAAVETLDRLDRPNATAGDETDESAARPDLLSVDAPDHDDVEAVHDNDPVALDEPEWATDDRLCILFTSGTTGDPKPVELTAGNVLSSAVASAFRLGIDPEDSWLVTLSLHHMGGLAPVYRSTLYGTDIVLREEFDPGAAADDIDRYDVTGVSLVPTMLERMLDSRGTLADSLRVVLLGGAPATDELIERCENYSIPVFPTYGMTETASQVATARPQEAFDRVGTVGRPVFWTDLTVVDEDGTPVAPGETGELVVDGPTVTPGYYGNPEATSEAFSEYGLHTGDVGYVDEDRYVYVLNRRDDRIITGGENVQPGEVATVLREHPDVDDAAVVGLEDEEWGERVAALVVPTNGEIEEQQLLAFADDRLAGFKLPRTLGYVEELPRTLSGTVDRDEVRERLRNVGFEPERPSEDFDAAGFEPATPEPTESAESSEDSPSEDDPSENGPSDDSSEDRGTDDPGTETDDVDTSDDTDISDDADISDDTDISDDADISDDTDISDDADSSDDVGAGEDGDVDDADAVSSTDSSSNDSSSNGTSSNGDSPEDTPNGEDA